MDFNRGLSRGSVTGELTEAWVVDRRGLGGGACTVRSPAGPEDTRGQAMSEDDGHRILDLRERAALALTMESTESLTGLLQDIISVRRPLEDKYQEVAVMTVLQENMVAKPNQGLSAISTAFNILEKYGRNLLSPHKPKFWRAVKFNNPVFKTTVDGIQGGRAILRQYGYTVEQSDGMSFPEDVLDPDLSKVAAVTIEVAMLQIELEQLRKGAHPHPELFSRFLPAGGLPAQGGHQKQLVSSPSNSDSQVPSQIGATTAPLDTCCAVCSKENVTVHCQSCSCLLCGDCDGLYHRHPARVGHQRTPLWRGRPGHPGAPPSSEGPDRHSPSVSTPSATSQSPCLTGAVSTMTPTTSDPEEATRSAAKPGLGRRSMSAEQQGYWPSLPRPDRRPSDLTAASLPRLPWTCASCHLDNEARAVLCAGCERPRASRAPGAGEGRAASVPALRTRWGCRACTFQNEPTSVLCCACDRPRLAGRPTFVPGTKPAAASLAPAPSPPPSHQVAGWECQHCTFRNLQPGRICEVCNRTSARGQEADPWPGPTPCPHPKIQKLEERPEPPGEGSGGPDGAAAAGGGGGGGGAAVTDRVAELARQEDMRAAGLRLVHMIRMGEEKQVTPEEVFCALQCSGKDTPLQWLQAELPQVLETIAEVASQKGEAMAENEVGPVGREEARQAWLACSGHFEEAVQECVRVRAKKFREIHAMGFADRQQVLQALYMNGGDVDKAVIDLQRHLLEPFHARIWQEDEALIQLDQADKQRVLRQILATYNLPSWGRAEIVLSLMQEGREHYQIHDVVEAVKESPDKEFIKRMLSLTCLVCLSLFPRSKMQSLTSCECPICRDCFKQYFTFTVRERHIKNLVCPGCSKPDIDDEGQLLSYFSTLDVQLRDCLDVDAYNLFHKKLTERTLMKDPKFKWCTHCSNGFIYDGNQSKVTCPQCKGSFCVECKRPWEQQHQGISCDDFQNWKRENDPEYQAQGLAAYLKENGIDCPNCRFRYALAKGGCMHFKCSQCRHEFCSGCYNTFLAKNKCNDPVCRLKESLHAHHPRDCLSYLRDWPVNRLQALLQNNNVNFDTDPPIGAEPTPGGRCRVMEQREVGDSLSDEPCGVTAHEGHAGLCESHYKEYLVSRINAHSLDPAHMFDEAEMELCLKRSGKAQPSKAAGEEDATYRNRMLKVISSIPLGDKVPRIKR